MRKREEWGTLTLPPPPWLALHWTALVLLDLTHLKTYCCIVQPGKSAAELHWHCLVKFIWNNGDLELLSHICVPAREGTIGFYMEHWFIPQLLSTTCEVTEQGISSSGKLLQFECHNSKVDWNCITFHFYYSFLSVFILESRGETLVMDWLL